MEGTLSTSILYEQCGCCWVSHEKPEHVAVGKSVCKLRVRLTTQQVNKIKTCWWYLSYLHSIYCLKILRNYKMFPITSRTGPVWVFPMELVSWKLLKLRMKHFLSQPNFVFIVKCCMRLSLLAGPSLSLVVGRFTFPGSRLNTWWPGPQTTNWPGHAGGWAELRWAAPPRCEWGRRPARWWGSGTCGSPRGRGRSPSDTGLRVSLPTTGRKLRTCPGT